MPRKLGLEYYFIGVIVRRMRKPREVSEDSKLQEQPKTPLSRSDARLRRLFNAADRTADQRKKAQLKAEFIREFYEGSR